MSANALLDARVEMVERLKGDIVALRLVSANGKVLPAFEAGAHIDVKIDEKLTRQYSLCGDPEEAGVYHLGVLKDPDSRGGSTKIYEQIKVGDAVKISPPKNLFPLAVDADYSVLVGGGIGITPIMAMAYALYRKRKSFEIRYCVSNSDKAAFLEALKSSPFAESVHLHVSREDDELKYKPAEQLPEADTNAHVYVCGPTGFMDSVLDAARAKGYGDDNLHKEDFGADVDVTGAAFTVEARATGVTLPVGENQSIVQVLEQAGIHVEVSCEEGVCGTCLCDVLDGEPDHRDSFLTEEERDSNEMIMVCCSRSKTSKLVLDV